MDFRVTEDQEALRSGISSFCEARLSSDALVELATKPFDRTLWSEVAELGVLSVRVPEEAGGLGLGMAEAVLVFAELGRRLVPGPLLWSAMMAPSMPGIVEGKEIVTGLDLGQPSSDPILIEHFEASETLVVIEPEGVRRIELSELEATPIETPLDPLTPVHRVQSLPPGDSIGDADLARRMRSDGALLAASIQIGIGEATLELARTYALQREQFDRPIGSFQSIKHILADMFARQELARAAVYAAAATADGRGVEAPERTISVAKLMAGEAAHKNARMCIQIYGGMGYVWEMPPHFYLKRALVLENAFGTMDHHADRVAEMLGAQSPRTAAPTR